MMDRDDGKLKMLFRVDCDRNVGTGHIVRCCEMADYFTVKGFDTYFLINDFDFVEKRVSGKNYSKISFDCISDEIKATRQFLENKTFDVIVVDFYEKSENEELMKVFENYAGKAVIAITDDFRKVDIKSDILIANHPLQKQYDYANNGRIVLAGEKYEIIPRGFINNKISVRKEVENVLITFGGHDPYNTTLKVAQYMETLAENHDLSKIKFNFLIGAIYRHEDQLRRFFDKKKIHNSIHKNLLSVVPLFTEMDLAVTAGGNTLYELCNLGVPVMVIALDERQDKGCRELAKRNLIIYAGSYCEIQPEVFEKSFLRLLNSYADRLNLHENCSKYFQFDALNELNMILKEKLYEA